MSTLHHPSFRSEEAVGKATAGSATTQSFKVSAWIGGLQTVVALLWPVLQWVLAADVAWQFAKMLFYWNTAGSYAGWRFILHFSVYVGLIYFIAVYRPKA